MGVSHLKLILISFTVLWRNYEIAKHISRHHAGYVAEAQGVIVLSALILYILQAYPAHAVESGRLIEKDGQYVFVESMDPATRLLLERSYEKGIITQEERDKAIKESETRAYLMQPSFKLWYDRGFNFSMNDNAFLLKIRGRMQLRETTRWRNDAWRNLRRCQRIIRNYWVSSATTVRTVRMILPRNSIYDGLGCLFLGHLLSPDFKYFLQIGFETAENAQTPGSANLAGLLCVEHAFPAVQRATRPIQNLLQPLADQQYRLHAVRRTGAGHGRLHGQRP